MNYLMIFFFLMPLDSQAGGRGGNDTSIFWFFGLVIVYGVSRIVGEKLIPHSNKTLQVFIGFFIALISVVFLGKLFK